MERWDELLVAGDINRVQQMRRDDPPQPLTLLEIIQLDQIQSTDRNLGNNVQDEWSEDFDKQEELACTLQPLL